MPVTPGTTSIGNAVLQAPPEMHEGAVEERIALAQDGDGAAGLDLGEQAARPPLVERR